MRAYGALELTDASPAQTFVEPLTVAKVKVFLAIPESSPADTALDAMLSGFITAARAKAEECQNKDLITKQWDLALDLLLGHDAIAGAAYPLRFNSIYNFGIGYEIELRHPLVSVDLFTVRANDGTLTTLNEDTDYIIDTHRSQTAPPFGKVWPFYTPYPTSSVLIRFTSGYSATHPWWSNDGQVVLAGMLKMISGLYENRLPDSPEMKSAEYLMSYGFRPRAR